MIDNRRPTFPNHPPHIVLAAIGPVDADVLRRLRAELPGRFGAAVRDGEPVPIHPGWFDPAREQYQADAVLDELVARRPEDDWLLGILDGDLFVPGLNFIFGQATVGGCCAVIGLARLRGDFYGEPTREDRFHRRVLIEAVHELGHVAGLDHCADPSCVMHFSETIEDTDAKGPDFCAACTP